MLPARILLVDLPAQLLSPSKTSTVRGHTLLSA
jgi:hypothetical protein